MTVYIGTKTVSNIYYNSTAISGLYIGTSTGGGVPANAYTNKSGSIALTNKDGSVVYTRKAA